MITDRIGRHEVLLPVNHIYDKIRERKGEKLSGERKDNSFSREIRKKKKKKTSEKHMLRKEILRLGSKEIFPSQVKGILSSQTEFLLPQHMFPRLATQGNMSGNNVSAIMFGS